MSKTVYWMFVGALFKDSAPRVLKHYRPYVAQLEADAAALVEKQVAEEKHKQYYLENQHELEEEYLMLLEESSIATLTTRGGSFGEQGNETDNLQKEMKAGQKKESRNGEEERSNRRWWHKFRSSSSSSSNYRENESRKNLKLEKMKQKAKERALKEAAKVSLDYRPVMSRIITDYLFRCPSWQYAHLLSLQRVKESKYVHSEKRGEGKERNQDNRNNVYVYRFSHPTHIPGYQECWGKSCHTSELPYVFESMDVIRSNYSTLSSIAQNEAPVVSEYPYTDLVDSYKLVTKDDE